MKSIEECKDYIFDCKNKGKNFSGKKISKFKNDIEKLYPYWYCEYHNISIPICSGFNKDSCRNQLTFLNWKKGFDYDLCKSCKKERRSYTNREKFAYANSLKTAKRKERELNNFHVYKDSIEKYYIDFDFSMKEISEKIMIPLDDVKFSINKLGIKKINAGVEKSKNKWHSIYWSKYENMKNSGELNELFSKGEINKIQEKIGCSKDPLLVRLRNDGYITKTNTSDTIPEKIIKTFLSDIGVEYEENTRRIISPKELDIYIPEFEIGIEINGLYWHGENWKETNYHKKKTEECRKKNIHLLHFWDFEIIEKWNIVKSIILSYLNKNQKIYARETIIVSLDNKKTNDFLLKNHIQGICNSSLRYGLIYNDEIVSIMTFGKSRYDKNYQYELLRFCNKIGTNVIGGGSKLFKNSRQESVVSYSQKRLFSGKVYEKMGFELVGETNPNYFWVHRNKIFSRNQTMKHKLPDLLKENFDESLSEAENMHNIGAYRVFDCGNNKYVYNIG